MTNPQNLNDSELLSVVKEKAQQERNLTLQIIELLQEIRDRRLHSKRGYSSLHEFCVKELKYSDGAAYRRLKAMKLVEEMPEVIESIQSGHLTLTAASQLQSVFETKAKQYAPMTVLEKNNLFMKVQNKSKAEIEKTIAQVCPEVVKVTEKAKPINDNQVRLELVIDQSLFRKIEKLKSLTSHKSKTLVDLLGLLVDQELKRRDPELATASPEKLKKIKESKVQKHVIAKPTRYIPAATKRYIWKRDKGRCTFVDPSTQRRCESQYKLQYEHIEPFAKGGETSIRNMRLLCSSHNQLMAVKSFGLQKMNPFLS